MSTIETFDFNIDVSPAILWQYADKPNITALIEGKNAWLKTYYTDFWNNWYDDVFNLATANLFGLTIWSIILDFPLFVPINPTLTDAIFGFNEIPIINTYENFELGNFFPDGVTVLTEDEQRLMLQLKYYKLVTRGSVIDVNTFLDYLLGSLGGAWMLDNLDMSITYEFGYPISNRALMIIQDNDLLPRPAGVSISYIVPP